MKEVYTDLEKFNRYNSPVQLQLFNTDEFILPYEQLGSFDEYDNYLSTLNFDNLKDLDKAIRFLKEDVKAQKEINI